MRRVTLLGQCIVLAFVLSVTFTLTSDAEAPTNGEPKCGQFTFGGIVGVFGESSNVCEPPITSGVTIVSESGICTAGPLAFSKTEATKYRLLTAGHCVRFGGDVEGGMSQSEPPIGVNPECKAKPGEPHTGEKWYSFKPGPLKEQILIGKSGSYADNAKEDYGEICIENKEWMKAAPNEIWAVTARWDVPEEKRFLVNGEKTPAVTEESCHEGQTTGHSCGEVSEMPVAGTKFFSVVPTAALLLRGKQGDSGGPCYWQEPSKEVLMEGIAVKAKWATKEDETNGTPSRLLCQLLDPALKKLKLELVTNPIEILTGTPLPNATKGALYELQLSASGGARPYAWKHKGKLPKGMTLSKTGELLGIPVTTGTYNFEVTVEDSAKPKNTATKPLTLKVVE